MIIGRGWALIGALVGVWLVGFLLRLTNSDALHFVGTLFYWAFFIGLFAVGSLAVLAFRKGLAEHREE